MYGMFVGIQDYEHSELESYSIYNDNGVGLKYDDVSFIVSTRGGFWPLGIVVACVCLSVCVSVCLCMSVNHQFVWAIICHKFNLESPN